MTQSIFNQACPRFGLMMGPGASLLQSSTKICWLIVWKCYVIQFQEILFSEFWVKPPLTQWCKLLSSCNHLFYSVRNSNSIINPLICKYDEMIWYITFISFQIMPLFGTFIGGGSNACRVLFQIILYKFKEAVSSLHQHGNW